MIGKAISNPTNTKRDAAATASLSIGQTLAEKILESLK